MPEFEQEPQPESAGDETESLRETVEGFRQFEQLAREGLSEITKPETVGALASVTAESELVASFKFENLLKGYRGWFWTATVGRPSAEVDPTVLETELLPGDGALLAPAWVPWADRFAEYQASHEPDADADADADAESDADAEPESDDESTSGEDSAPTDAGVDEADDAEAESGDTHPEVPDVPRGDQPVAADEARD